MTHSVEPSDDLVDAALRHWGAAEYASAGEASPVATSADTARGRRAWLLPAAAAAAVVAIAAAATAVGGGSTSAPGPAGGVTGPASSGPEQEAPAMPPQPDGVLEITPAGAEVTPELTREQAEVLMLNSWPPPPLRDNAEDVPRRTSEVSFTVGRVLLGRAAKRLGDVPDEVSLAWVAQWTEPDAPRDCPTDGRQAYRPQDGTRRPFAYVLAADGSTGYYYTGPSTSCPAYQGPEPELRRQATAQRAVNRISVPWTGETRAANGDVLLSFDRPTCAGTAGVGDEQGQMIFVELPVGVTCTETVKATIQTGPQEPKHHPLLGPVRTVNGVFRPALEP